MGRDAEGGSSVVSFVPIHWVGIIGYYASHKSRYGHQGEINNMATVERNTWEPAVLALSMEIKLGTGNAKTGTAFSLPNILTCPGSTELCRSLCYASIPGSAMVRFGHQGIDGSYGKTWKALVRLLALDPELAVMAIIAAINRLPKWAQSTVRIHDSGDFFSPTYVRVWQEVARRMPHVKFWFYTRSWRVGGKLATELRTLAALDNVAGWVSADDECWLAALIEARDNSQWAGLAYMQTTDNDFPAILQKAPGKSRFLNFPAHGNGGRHLVDTQDELRNCPAITGKVTMPKARVSKAVLPACVKCNLCLPA